MLRYFGGQLVDPGTTCPLIRSPSVDQGTSYSSAARLIDDPSVTALTA